MKISLNNEAILADFFCLLFKGSKYIEKQLFNLCGGTSRLFLTQTILKKLIFTLPPLSEQKEIANKTDRILKILAELEEECDRRKNLAETLMQTVLREAFE